MSKKTKITVIGAGLGGLTSGALLAKKGYEVTVLEQHYVVGGSATAFKRKGFTCEVGLHEMDGLYTDGAKKKIFEALGVYDNIDFVRVPEFFRVKNNNLDFTMPDDPTKAVEALTKQFPNERKAIEKYFGIISKMASDFKKVIRAKKWQYLFFPLLYPTFYKYRKSSVKEVLDSFIDNEELKMILNSNIGYYTDRVDDFSFLYHSIGQNSYYTGGGWFIKGGSQKLSNYLAKVIKDNGGEIITSANVTSINEGVVNKEIKYTLRKQEFTISSDIVISNASPMHTYKMAGVNYENKKQIGNSLLTVYIGFKNNIKNIYGERPYSNFYFKEAVDIESYHKSLKKDIRDRGFIFVDYSQIDSQLTSSDKSFGVFCSVDHLSEWEGLTDEDYKAKKEELAQIYFDKLEEDYPNIRDHVEFFEVGTAKTMKRYLRTNKGTAYGFAPTPDAFLERPRVKSELINNLYFTGAWVIGGGFSPAIGSGGLCYNTIIKDYPIKDNA